MKTNFVPEESSYFIELTDEHYGRAQAGSERQEDIMSRYSTYLKLLSLEGFTQWLRERDIEVDTEDAILDFKDTVSNIRVNGFRVCLITVSSLIDNLLYIPKKVSAHYYVMAELREDEEELIIHGVLSANTLRELAKQERFVANYEYQIPYADYLKEPLNFLMYVQYTKPLKLATNELNKLTSEKVGMFVVQGVKKFVIDTKLWIEGSAQELAEHLEGTRMKTIVTQGANTDEFAKIITQLSKNYDLAIPSDLKPIYMPCQYQEIDVTLCMVVWQGDRQGNSPEDKFSLLNILSTNIHSDYSQQEYLPKGISLRVTEADDLEAGGECIEECIVDDEEAIIVNFVESQRAKVLHVSVNASEKQLFEQIIPSPN